MNIILEKNIEEVTNLGLDFEEFQEKFENESGYMDSLEDVYVEIYAVYSGVEELASMFLEVNGHEDISHYVDHDALGCDLLYSLENYVELDDGTIIEFSVA